MRIIDQYTIQEIEHLELLAKQAVEGFIIGLHKSPFHGFSAQFAEHRIYNQGDNIKNIDWKVYGRTDKLYTKRYEEETNLRCQIVLDASSSMYYPDANAKLNKIKFATFASACIVHMLYKQRDAFGLSIFHEHIQTEIRARGSFQHYQRIMNTLQNVLQSYAPNKNTNIVKALDDIAETTHRRSLIVIFSDMFNHTDNDEALFSALQHLRYNKHEVILFHVVDEQTETNLKFENRPYEMIDMETQSIVKLNPIELADIYSKAMLERKKQLSERCGQYKIEWVEVDIQKDYKQVLYPYFVKRVKML